MKIKCERCTAEHDGSFGSGRFCGRACANTRDRDEAFKENHRKIMKALFKDNPEWGERMNSISNSPEVNAKRKETWKKKREERWDSLSKGVAKYWYKKEVGEKCEVCQVEEWNGKRLPFEVHHLDGDNGNNKKENLQVLCPNCHSQTDTWRKIKK